MKRGSEAFQVLKIFLKPTLQILVWMMGLRILLYLSSFYSQIHWHPDLPAAFWAGFRFDFLVLGFIWIPVVVFTWLWALMASPRKLFQVWKLYFNLVVILIFDLTFFDFFWTAVRGTRMNSEVFQTELFRVVEQGWLQLGSAYSFLASVWIFVSAVLVAISVYRLQWKEPDVEDSKTKLAFQVFISIFAVAFAARGTWTPHHLNIEHAQVSDDKRVNQLPLNAVWNLDK